MNKTMDEIMDEIMDETKALAIVSALANGVNPITGEIFSADSPYQAVDVVRALFFASRALATTALEKTSRTRSRARLPGNAGKRWTQEEDRKLLGEFDRGCAIPDLAQAHGLNGVAGVQGSACRNVMSGVRPDNGRRA